MFKFKSTQRFRSQLMIDAHVQLAILQRVALYTAACAIYFMVVLFYCESAEFGHESVSRTLRQCLDVVACWAPGVTLMLPIIAYDILIFSNRIAGPMFRLRREMQRLVDQQSDQPIELRDNDYWPEIATLFNQIQAEILELRSKPRQPSSSLFAAAQTNHADDLLFDSTNSAVTPAAKQTRTTESQSELELAAAR